MVTTASYAKKDEAIEMQFWKDLGMWPRWPQGTIKSGLGRQFIAYWGPGPPGKGQFWGLIISQPSVKFSADPACG